MIAVSVTYDTKDGTWNVMSGLTCVFYGTVWQVEQWLIDNEDKYEEVAE